MYELGRKSHYRKEAEQLESECLNNDGEGEEKEKRARENSENRKPGDKVANGSSFPLFLFFLLSPFFKENVGTKD